MTATVGAERKRATTGARILPTMGTNFANTPMAMAKTREIAKQINTLPNVDKSDSQNAPSNRYCQMLCSVAPMDGNTNSLPTCKNIKCHTSSINAMDASGYNMGVSFLKRDCFI